MDALETLIRDTLVEHATEAPPASSLAVSRRRRWPYVVLAAASVIGLAVGLSLAVPGNHPGRGPVVSPGVHRPAPGMKTIFYAGVSLDVPDRLGVQHSFCGSVTNAVVTVDPVDSTIGCPFATDPDHARGTTVIMQRGTSNGPLPSSTLPPVRLTIGGRSQSVVLRPTTERDYVRASVLYRDVTIDVQATRSTVVAILTSVGTYSTDSLGCAAAIASQVPSQEPASTLVPGRPTGAYVCDYATALDVSLNAARAGGAWELDSHRLSAVTATRLATTMNALPRTPGAPLRVTFPRHIVFTYAGGGTRTVLVDGARARWLVTDGTIRAADVHAGVYHLANGIR